MRFIDHSKLCPPQELAEPYFKSCLIGVALPTPTCAELLVYDYDKMVQVLQGRYGFNRAEAEIFLKANYLDRYRGVVAPIIMKQVDANQVVNNEEL